MSGTLPIRDSATAGSPLSEPLETDPESLGLGRLDLRYNRPERREWSREEMIMDREGEAAKQANSIKRTTEEGRQEDRRSERVCKKKETPPRERKQEMRSIPLVCSLQETEWERQKG